MTLMAFSPVATVTTVTTCLMLFLLLQVQSLPASELVSEFKICGADHFAYSDSLGDLSLYLNGYVVEKLFFCDALKFHYINGCFFEDYWSTVFCGIDLSQVKSPISGGRKLLQTHMEDRDAFATSFDLGENKTTSRTSLSRKTISFAVPGMFALCCVALCPCFYRKRKETAHAELDREPSSVASLPLPELNSAPEKRPGSPFRVPPSPSRFSMSPKLSRLGSTHLNLNQVIRATRNFSPSMVIGEGGFGTVYKAQLEDGQVVAVKRAKKEYFESLRTEFSSEVDLLAKIDHRNLVKLLGYVDKGNERLIITEYVPNGTLRAHLDGLRGRILDFNQRLEIAIDVAHGLTYLHLYTEKPIIHRDVKSSNIILTESMRAKVADFGFARLGTAAESDKTHVSTKVKGTVGYLDPEYMRTYQLTAKSDVYSFGILLMEILTGRRPVEQNRAVEERVTLRWVFKKFNEGNVTELADPRMEEAVDPEILVRIISLAIQCAAPVRLERPDMKIVGEQLWGIRVDYLKTVRRGY